MLSNTMVEKGLFVKHEKFNSNIILYTLCIYRKVTASKTSLRLRKFSDTIVQFL